MSFKIFHCRQCGARVGWNESSCPVCNRLVSNDNVKRRIVVCIIAGIVVILLAVAIMLHLL